MAKLTGQTIAASYDQLLIVGDADGITATPQAVESADTGGNASLLYISTTEVYNPGTGGDYNTAFGENAGVALASGGNSNVLIGNTAGAVTTTGDNNTAVGYQALATNILGTDNVAIGYQAMHDQDSGSTASNSDHNIAIGSEAMGGAWSNSNKSEQNVSIGSGTMAGVLNNAYYNVVIGKAAGAAMTSGSRNVVVGREAFGVATAASDNVAIGDQALDAAAQSETANIAIGKDAMSAINEGTNSGSGAANVDHNVAIGYQAFLGGTFGAQGDSTDRQSLGNVAIGANALDATAANPSIGQVAIGQNALSALTTGGSNISIGYQAGQTIQTGGDNVIIGHQAMDAAHSDTDSCVAIGVNAMGGSHTGTRSLRNVAVGNNTMAGAMNDADNNVAVGYGAMQSLTEGDANVVVGFEAGVDLNTGDDNTLIGYKAGENITSSDQNVIIGSGAGATMSSGTNNCVLIGQAAGDAIDSGDAAGTVAIGYHAGGGTTSGQWGTFLGYEAGYSNSTGNSMTAIGYQAGYYNTTDHNVFIGMEAGLYSTSADSCVFIGTGAGKGVSGVRLTGNNNVLIGRNSGSVLQGAISSNTFVGHDSGGACTTGSSNVLIGADCGKKITTSAQTVAVGALSMSAGASSITGVGHACFGYGAGYKLEGATAYNTLIGQDCGNEMTTGSYNTCVGKGAGDNITTGESNTCVGYNVQPSAADGDYQFVMGEGISGGGDNTFRVGKASNYISASLSGTQTFTVSSDVRKKRNINDNNLGLEFINDIKTKTFQWRPADEYPEEWEAFKEDSDGNRVYDKMDTETIQYGMIAQEVKESIGKFDADTFPGWNVDPKGIQEVSKESFVIPLIKAVQELSQQVEDLKKQIN